MGILNSKDKIGALSHSAGNILMAASISNPAYLTIGGRQFKVSAQLSVALPSMTANTRYQVYAVQSAGVVSLVISANENSVGPVGYASWKLVGSLYANGLSPVGFGSFLSIEGAIASEILQFLPTGSWLTNITYTGRYRRVGDMLEVETSITLAGATTNTSLQVNLPSGLVMDTAKMTNLTLVSGEFPKIGDATYDDNAVSTYWGPVYYSSTTQVYCYVLITNGTYAQPTNLGATTPFVWAAGDKISIKYSVPIVGWTISAIEEL